MPTASATRVGAPVLVVTLAEVSARAVGDPGTTQMSSSSLGVAALPAGRRIVTRRMVAMGPSATGARRTPSSAGSRFGDGAGLPAAAGTGAAAAPTVAPDDSAPGPRRLASAATAVRIASSSGGSGGDPGGGVGSRLISSSVATLPTRSFVGTASCHRATGAGNAFDVSCRRRSVRAKLPG